MRVGIWNQGDYAGYPEEAGEAGRVVPRHTRRRKAQRRRAANASPTEQCGEWIADAERPAEQYRGRYQLQLEEAKNLLESARAAQPRRAAPAPPRRRRLRPRRRRRSSRRRAPIDADQFGRRAGRVASPTPRRARSREQEHDLRRVGVADIKAGRIDPRIIAVLTSSARTTRSVSCMCSDHRLTRAAPPPTTPTAAAWTSPRSTARSSAPAAPLARRTPRSSASFPVDPPDEIGSPFAISGPGYFTDAAHQNHIHFGFKTESRRLGTPRRTRRRRPRRRPAGRAAPPPRPRRPPARAPRRRRPGARLRPVRRPRQARRPSRARRLSRRRRRRDDRVLGSPPRRARRSSRPPPRRAARPRRAGRRRASTSAGPERTPATTPARSSSPRGWPSGREARPPAATPGHGRARRVRPEEPQLRRRRPVGFFQMRAAHLEPRRLRGLRENPEQQVEWFLDTAERVKAKRQARGQSVTDPEQFGEWIADVERPAEQYRGRYQIQLEEANDLLKNAPEPPRRAGRQPRRPARRAVAEAAARRRWPRARVGRPRPRSTEAKKYWARRTSGAARRRRRGSTARAWSSGRTRKQGVEIPRVTDQQILATNGDAVSAPSSSPATSSSSATDGRRPPRRHVARRRQVHPRAAHGRRGEDLQPRRGLLQGAVPRRAAFRQGGDRRAGRTRRAGVAARRARPSARPPSPARRPRWPATPPRPAARAAGSSRPSASRRRATTRRRDALARRRQRAAPQRLGAVPPGDHARAGRRGARPPRWPRPRRRRRPRHRWRSPPPRPPRRAPAPEVAARRRPAGSRSSPTSPPATRATTRARRRSPSGSPSRPRRPGCRPSCRSWPRSSSPASRTSTSATRTASASSRCARASGTRASTPATRRTRDCRPSGSSTTRSRTRSSRSPRRRRLRQGPGRRWGEWIADVERPAEQYRGRYQLRLEEARRLLR